MVSCLFCCKCSQHLFEGRFTAPFKFKIVFYILSWKKAVYSVKKVMS